MVHAVYQPSVVAGVGQGLWRFGNHLDIGPSIFFVISGFLLYRPFVAARAGGRKVSVPAYGVRRVLRIVPPYWVALTIITAWFGLEAVRDDPLRFYGFAQVYSGETALIGMPQAWTLCVEVPFYLCLPVWALAVRALAARLGASVLRSELAGIGALLVLGVMWNGIALTHTDPASLASGDLLLVLPAFADQLALGMLLAVASVAWSSSTAGASPRVTAALGRLHRVPGGAWWLAALAAWLMACFVAGPDGSPGDRIDDAGYLTRHVLNSVAALLIVAPAVFGERGEGRVRRALAWRPAVLVGTISYSVYLWHFAVFGQVARWWGGAPAGTAGWVAWTLAIVAGSLVLGAVSYCLIETPSMRLGRRMARRLTRRDGPPAEELPVPEPVPATGA
jgi:peptidoglycan/LPS O-acetylase OafA/YrhL